MSHSAIHQLSAEQVAALPRDAAGRKCTVAVPVMNPHMTSQEVREFIQRNIGQYETINYVYVVDEWGIFIGVLSLKELYAMPPQHVLGEACKREGIIFVRPDGHQERVAYLALRHNIKAVPVVDTDHRLVGVIPSDAILRILYKEVHEDLLRMAGVRHTAAATIDNVFQLSILQSFQHRAPWLFIGMIGGIGAAWIIGFFEHVLRDNIILAAFIPLIVYMGGAVAAQTQTFLIRDLAIERRIKFVPYFFRQALIVALLAALFSTIVGVYALVRHDDVLIAYTLGISLLVAISSSIFSGIVIPFALSRFRMDPANAGGPLVTITQDIVSIVLYFTVATSLL